MLDKPEFISLDSGYEDSKDSGANVSRDIPSYDLSIDQHEDRDKLEKAWQSLTAEERFVLEAMKLDNQDAKSVLITLRTLNISIKKGVAPDKVSEQQLYYFLRKSWKKLVASFEF